MSAPKTRTERDDIRANPTEQKRLIAGLMASRRAAWRSDGRSVDTFPRFEPGMRTADYVKAFKPLGKKFTRWVPCPMIFADRAAPFLVGAEMANESEQLELGAAP